MRISDWSSDVCSSDLPAAIRTGIVHFGPGAFHRAHQASYVDTLLDSDPRWGIAAVSLRSAGTVDALARQDGLYSLTTLGRETGIRAIRSEEHTSELQSLMRISYAGLCLKKKQQSNKT